MSHYQNINVSGGRNHLGNVYHQGLSPDQIALQSILESLRYDDMFDRRDRLDDALEGTFDWALKDGEAETGPFGNWDTIDVSFRTWLETGEKSLFCFLGKPGSGKSTIMKFLSTHPEVEEASCVWSAGKSVLRAEHFFWVPGSHLQKSYEGMLRSLLFQCLTALSGSDTHSGLVKDVCRARWGALNKRSACTRRELEATFIRLISTSTDLHFLFFVDGLDECEPQERLGELASDLIRISNYPNVKMCVSCRPWMTLTRPLASYPDLHIDKLTYNDMWTYTRDRLTWAERDICDELDFQKGDERVLRLVESIVDKAEGVFLWVVLLVNELVSEMRKSSDTELLLQIVETFPFDLEAYFRKTIYDRIPKNALNMSETASALKVALAVHDKVAEHERRAHARDDILTDRRQIIERGTFQEPLELVFDGVALLRPNSVANFWLLQMGYLDDGRPWTDLEPAVYSKAEVGRMVTKTKFWLAETCRDLLVVSGRDEADEGALGVNVEFVHRTVFDFLRSDTIRSNIDRHAPRHLGSESFFAKLARLQCVCLLGDPTGSCDILEYRFGAACQASIALPHISRPIRGCSEDQTRTFHSNCRNLSDACILHICLGDDGCSAEIAATVHGSSPTFDDSDEIWLSEDGIALSAALHNTPATTTPVLTPAAIHTASYEENTDSLDHEVSEVSKKKEPELFTIGFSSEEGSGSEEEEATVAIPGRITAFMIDKQGYLRADSFIRWRASVLQVTFSFATQRPFPVACGPLEISSNELLADYRTTSVSGMRGDQVRLFEILLNDGCDPNAVVETGGTLWQEWLARAFFETADDKRLLLLSARHRYRQHVTEVVALMLRHGADPDCALELDGGGGIHRTLSLEQVLGFIVPPGDLAATQYLREFHSATSVYRHTRRTQRLRGARALVLSESRRERIERQVGEDPGRAKRDWHTSEHQFFVNFAAAATRAKPLCFGPLSHCYGVAWCLDCEKLTSACAPCSVPNNEGEDLLDLKHLEILAGSSVLREDQHVTLQLSVEPSWSRRGHQISLTDVPGAIRIVKDWYRRNELAETQPRPRGREHKASTDNEPHKLT